MFTKSRGFTLIELLVVISIIGLLSSIVLASLNTARAKARDTKRIANVREMQKAIELYYDKNGYYPGSPLVQGGDTRPYYSMAPYIGTNGSDCGYVDGTPPTGRWCTLETMLSPFIKSLPRDDMSTQVNYRYLYKYNNSLNMYAIAVILENANSISQNDGGFFSNRFEVGNLPAYCKSKYPTGSGGDWSQWNYTYGCYGDDPASTPS